LPKDELEKKLEKITQYCAELEKTNRILDLENKIAVNHLVKLQKTGHNIDLVNTKISQGLQTKKSVDLKKTRFKL